MAREAGGDTVDEYEYGVVDEKGNEIIPCVYSELKYETPIVDMDQQGIDEYIVAKKGENDLYGYVSLSDGSTLIELQFKEAGTFLYDDPATVCNKDGKWMLIDRNGKNVMGAEYEGAGDFHGRAIAPVMNKKGKWAFIDRDGETVTGFKYDFNEESPIVADFDDGRLLEVCVNDKKGNCLYGLIDQRGKEILPCRYYQISGYENGKATVVTTPLEEKMDEEVIDLKDYEENKTYQAGPDTSSYEKFIYTPDPNRDVTGYEADPEKEGGLYAISNLDTGERITDYVFNTRHFGE